MNITEIFIKLIKNSLGHQEHLSTIPTAEQWSDLFWLAQQQTLVGVCFAGVQRLKVQVISLPQQLYYEWLIHQQNEQLNRKVG